MKNNCPLCLGELESLYNTEDHEESGFHYRCTKCNHGWYIADLMGMCFKDKDKVKEIIKIQDKEKEDAGKSNNG
ncbi:hypothetical protein LCGC14_1761310 [marine sediment metagenome]|uniref:Uncharacterized protein n=1 Tax=marine sediment metagenome TaxID=412755 RepID=A0A0F9JFZ5_9ZZZZ